MAFKTTTNHEEIRGWVEEKGGYPAVVTGTTTPVAPGVLRIGEHEDDPNLRKITWTEFFDHFESGNLAFRYSDDPETDSGKEYVLEDLFVMVDRDDSPTVPEDTSTIPDADQDMAEGNIYPDAPPEK